MEAQKIMVDGVTLNVRRQGQGARTLLFLHYFGGSGRTWEPVMARLSEDFSCCAPDGRGWGDSDAPPTGYTVDDMADDVLRLAAALGLRRYALVGHSMGGKTSLAVAARRPPGLETLLLVAPSPPSPEPMDDAERARLRDGWGRSDAAEETLAKITAHPLPAPLAGLAVADTLRASRVAWNAWLDGGSREDIQARMEQIAVSTHILAGAADKSLTPDLLRREVQSYIAGATLAAVPQAAHLLPLEAPDAVAAFIREALSENVSGKSPVRLPGD